MEARDEKARSDERCEQWGAALQELENTTMLIDVLKESVADRPEQFPPTEQFSAILEGIRRDQELVRSRMKTAPQSEQETLVEMFNGFEDWYKFLDNHPFIVPCMSIQEAIDTLVERERVLKEKVAKLEKEAGTAP